MDSFLSHISSTATPIFVHIHQQRPNQPEHRSTMREHLHHPVSVSNFTIEPFKRIDGMNGAVMFVWEGLIEDGDRKKAPERLVTGASGSIKAESHRDQGMGLFAAQSSPSTSTISNSGVGMKSLKMFAVEIPTVSDNHLSA